jgi:hypothetical protein
MEAAPADRRNARRFINTNPLELKLPDSKIFYTRLRNHPELLIDRSNPKALSGTNERLTVEGEALATFEFTA